MDSTTSAPISQKTVDLLIPYQTMHNKLRFWLSYLHEVLPPQYTIVYIDEDENTYEQIFHISVGTTQLRIRIQLQGQTVMRGIIHTTKAKEDAYKTVVVEQTLDDRVPEPNTFFTANKLLCFYAWDMVNWGWATCRKPDKTLDPIKDADGVRSHFAKALEVAPGMSRAEYAEWEKEVEIDDEAMAKKDGNLMGDEFVAVGDWPREWFREGTFGG